MIKRKSSGLYLLAYILCIVLPLVSWRVFSATNVTLKVTVLAPLSCLINGNKPIEINFGNSVQVEKIDGSAYLKDVTYDMSCTTNNKNSLKMKISGQAANFDSGALKTDQDDLGIALYNSSTKVGVNEWFSFTWPDKPQLKAVPVKKAGATLKTGAFSASATMMVAYQ